jgi:pyruvyltransferase
MNLDIKSKIVDCCRRFGKSVYYHSQVPCLWSKSNNWGDALNPFLVSKITDKKVRYDENRASWKYMVIGSIMERADSYSIVWGSGMMRADMLPTQRPYKIHAVRGPLTRSCLISNGIKCPDVYGDPALLLGRYLSPERSVKWRVGVIPHYSDTGHEWVEQTRREENVCVINVNSGTEDFVQQVVACESILSSSLHGLICADTYGIPNRQIQLSGNPRIGGDFKFMDYCAGVERKYIDPLYPKLSDTAVDLAPAIEEVRICVNYEKLWESCPFR